MMNNKITLFILDDNIHTIPTFVENGIYEKGIDKTNLSYLAQNYKWKGEDNLQELIINLLNHEYVKEGKLKSKHK